MIPQGFFFFFGLVWFRVYSLHEEMYFISSPKTDYSTSGS